MRVPLQRWSWLLMLLLVALGGLQYRWIGELSEADRARLERARVSEADAFVATVDREVTRLFGHFFPRRFERGRPEKAEGRGSSGTLADLAAAWRSEAQHPDLLGRIYRVEAAFTSSARATLLQDGRFEEAPLPAGLEFVGENRRRGAGRGVGPVLSPGFVVIPQSRPRPGRGPLRPPDVLLALELDLDYLAETLFPEAAERLQLADFEVAVRGAGGDWLYATDAVESFGAADLFGTLPHLRRIPEGADAMQRRDPPRGGDRGPWGVYVRHTRPIDRVVGAARRRNLLLSLGTLGVLAASMVLVTSAASRAQRTARQQVTFVASLTHELHTPLAAIAAAAANLSDGIVDEKERVRDYGKLIQREGRRLESLVSQSLQLAGIRSGSQRPRETVTVERWIDESLEGCAWLAEERNVTLGKELSDATAEITGDAEALVQALRNLLTNALKHSPSGAAVIVRSFVEGGRLIVEVTDEGPGFPIEGRADLLRAFARAADDGTTGTGLGLHVAQQILDHHDGSIELLDREHGAQGARVRLRLPLEGARS
ncbi:MAG: HAMP domain-containing sensor histidine kinase [Acidobacteriota bacterium]